MTFNCSECRDICEPNEESGIKGLCNSCFEILEEEGEI